MCFECQLDEDNYNMWYYDDYPDYYSNTNNLDLFDNIPSFEQLSTMDVDELKIWVRSQIEDNKENNIVDLIQSITQS